MILLIKAELHVRFEAPEQIKFWVDEQSNYKRYFEDLFSISKYSSIKYLDIAAVPRGIKLEDFGYVYFEEIR